MAASCCAFVARAAIDLQQLCCGSSELPLWRRVWIALLFFCAVLPLVFLPDWFACFDLVACLFVSVAVLADLVRLRGLSKRNAWVRMLSFLMVVLANAVSLMTNFGAGDCEEDGPPEDEGSAHWQTRLVVVWVSTVVMALSVLEDAIYSWDFFMLSDVKVLRSHWTLSDMRQEVDDTQLLMMMEAEVL